MKHAAAVTLFPWAAIVGSAQGRQYVISTYAGGAPPPTPAPGLYMWFGSAQSVATDSAGNAERRLQ
jgi:hypothetical protein